FRHTTRLAEILSNNESGPLWRGRRTIGQPRDVGSPLCQGARICRHQGPKHFHFPSLADLSSFGANVAQLRGGASWLSTTSVPTSGANYAIHSIATNR